MNRLLLTLLMTASLTPHAQTVKKVMLEDFSGMWCATCPNGSKAVDDMDALHGNKFIAIATHNNDGLNIPDGDSIDFAFGVSTYPAAAIDRKKSGGDYVFTTGSTGATWKSKVASRLDLTAIASVSFDNMQQVNDSTYEGDIKVKFTSAATAGVPINVNVYLLENKIEAKKYFGTQWGNIELSQKNSTTHYGHNGSGWTYTTTASSGGTFYFEHVLRASLGGVWGWTGVVPASPATGTEYTRHFSFVVSPTSGMPQPWNPANMDVVGFVSYNGSLAADQKEILNVERVQLSAFTTSIKEKEQAVTVLQTYPNPASSNDVVNIEYHTKHSGTVTLTIYDAAGRIAARPYTSDEVSGAHTIMWQPANDNLSPGVYFAELSAGGERLMKKICLQ